MSDEENNDVFGKTLEPTTDEMSKKKDDENQKEACYVESLYTPNNDGLSGMYFLFTSMKYFFSLTGPQ